MTKRTKASERVESYEKAFREERDARLNLLYQVERIRFHINSFRPFSNQDMQKQIDANASELRHILNEIVERFGDLPENDG